MLNTVSRLVTSVFGSRNQRLLKRYGSFVAAANALEASLTPLSDDALRAKTAELKARYAAHQDLDALLPEAFALTREAARRTLGMRHFDVQFVGGIALHQGKIAEMRTGEGKTLVAPLAAILNALAGRGVHVITVNDYLARRDPQWMGPVFHFLGLSVGMITHDASYIFEPGHPTSDERLINLRPCSRQEAYAADITYGKIGRAHV